MKKKVISLLLVGAMAASMAACGNSSTNDTGDAASAGAETAGTEEGDTSEGDGVTLVVASVNNDPFLVLEEESAKFTEETGINVKFEILSENEIRSKIQEDVGLGGGNYDLMTLGTSDMATYYSNGWTEGLDSYMDGMDAETAEWYDFDDYFDSVIASDTDSASGTLAALTFYSESTMICYNTEIFEDLGLTMPENPTWDDILDLAKQCDGYSNADLGYDDVSGIAIRGLAGYGENGYIFGSILNSFGGAYYDTDWNTIYDSDETRSAWEFYKNLLEYAEDSPTSCGYTECLNLFTQGQAAIYYDATVSAATFESDSSSVQGKVGYAAAPSESYDLSATIGGWGIAIASGSEHKDEAFQFLTWATSKEYQEIVAEDYGWASVPSATRASLYENEDYLAVAPFAEMTAASLAKANFAEPAAVDVPYTGTSLPNITEYSSWGTTIAEELSAYVSGTTDIDTAMDTIVKAMDDAAEEGGYRD